jgi:hypothetical protein
MNVTAQAQVVSQAASGPCVRLRNRQRPLDAHVTRRLGPELPVAGAGASLDDLLVALHQLISAGRAR